MTLAGIHDRLGHLEGQSEQVDGRLDGIDGRLDGVEGRLGKVEGGLIRLEARFEATLLYLATKADIAELRTDGERLRVDMERLRADMEHQLRLMTWTIAGVMLAGFTVIAALLRLWG